MPAPPLAFRSQSIKPAGRKFSRSTSRSSSCLSTVLPDGLIDKCTWLPLASTTSSSRRAYGAPLAPVMPRTKGCALSDRFFTTTPQATTGYGLSALLRPHIKRRNSQRQREPPHVPQARSPHPLGQRLALRKLSHA